MFWVLGFYSVGTDTYWWIKTKKGFRECGIEGRERKMLISLVRRRRQTVFRYLGVVGRTVTSLRAPVSTPAGDLTSPTTPFSTGRGMQIRAYDPVTCFRSGVSRSTVATTKSTTTFCRGTWTVPFFFFLSFFLFHPLFPFLLFFHNKYLRSTNPEPRSSGSRTIKCGRWGDGDDRVHVDLQLKLRSLSWAD